MSEEPMTPEEFENRMKEIVLNLGSDCEESHYEHDKLMCDLLRSLGYEAGVEVFETQYERKDGSNTKMKIQNAASIVHNSQKDTSSYPPWVFCQLSN